MHGAIPPSPHTSYLTWSINIPLIPECLLDNIWILHSIRTDNNIRILPSIPTDNNIWILRSVPTEKNAKTYEDHSAKYYDFGGEIVAVFFLRKMGWTLLHGVDKIYNFLGSFAKFLRATVNLRRVCPSPWNNSAPTGRILMKFKIWALFRKISRENSKFFLKSDKNNGYFTWRPAYSTFVVVSCWIFLTMRNICRQKL